MARLVMVAGILALTAVLLVGCGGGNDRAKVEASLQHYLVSLVPEDGPFPIGAGPPRVKDNGCKDGHVRDRKGLAIWACVVKFGTYPMPVVVVVDDSTEVVSAVPGVFKQFDRLGICRISVLRWAIMVSNCGLLPATAYRTR